MMHFNQQQDAVLYVIWKYWGLPPGSDKFVKAGEKPITVPEPPPGWKPGQPRRLNQKTVVQQANILLKKDAIKVGAEPKQVGRGNWTDKKASAEWKGIYLALQGGETGEPIPQAVLDALAAFDERDKTHIESNLVDSLMEEIKVKDNFILELNNSREEFETKAYTRQYIEAETYDLLKDLKKNYEAAHERLAAEEQTRIKIEQRNRKLNEELVSLKKDFSSLMLGAGGNGESTNPPVDFSPKLAALDKNSNQLMRDYRQKMNEAWDALIDKADKKAPDYIFIIFHKFNIDIKKYITESIPVPHGVTSYVFACYQPNASKRERWFAKACEMTKSKQIKPVVIIVDDGTRFSVNAGNDNVVQFPSGAIEIADKLRVQALKELDKADPCNPVVEGFRQVWIERGHA